MSSEGGAMLRKRPGEDEAQGGGGGGVPPARGGPGKKRKGHNKFQKTAADTLKTDGITFAKSNSAPQLVMSKDFKEVTGEKGYRMARTAHGVSSGNWYWECEILQPEKADAQAHWRLGWSQRQGDVQAPVGYDRWSYAYRDIDGSRVHDSTREDGWGETYGPGDVIGFLICLPNAPENSSDPHSFKSGGGGSTTNSTTTTANNTTSSQNPSFLSIGNHIRFFKNGKDLGVAYSHIPPGIYYPAVSLYMGARIRANFGPDWVREPLCSNRSVTYRAISDLQEILVKREEQDPHQQLLLLQQQALQRVNRARKNQAVKAARLPPPKAELTEDDIAAAAAANGGGNADTTAPTTITTDAEVPPPASENGGGGGKGEGLVVQEEEEDGDDVRGDKENRGEANEAGPAVASSSSSAGNGEEAVTDADKEVMMEVENGGGDEEAPSAAAPPVVPAPAEGGGGGGGDANDNGNQN